MIGHQPVSLAGASLGEEIGECTAAVTRVPTTAVDCPDHVMQTLPGSAGQRSLCPLHDRPAHELRDRGALDRRSLTRQLIQMAVKTQTSHNA